MATPPPVPASQRYPVQIRDFVTYQNQPGDKNRHTTYTDPNNPGGTITVDLVLDDAVITNDLHTEIVSIEKAIGGRAFTVPGQPTIGRSIWWLYYNKAAGKPDPGTHCIHPLPRPSHDHSHTHISGDAVGDDHPQYMRTNGTRAFTAPVTAHNATRPGHLITLRQAQGAGLTRAQVQTIINNALAGASDHPILGPGAGRYRMTGGFLHGYTDTNGNIYVDFSAAKFSRIVTFVYMKMPYPGESMLGWYAFQYMEDQLPLLALSPQGAWIQFIEDIVVDRQALVAMSWLAVGA